MLISRVLSDDRVDVEVFDDGHWLQPGDTLSLRLDEIGEIHHTVAMEG
jgi:hypothetical protein